MDLRKWLEQEEMTIQDFADRVPVDRSYISKVLTGNVHPSLAVALDIHDACRREVPLEQFLPRGLRPRSGAPEKPGSARKQPGRKVSRSHASA
jgi:transcriptional regulator with XRE-family HTH domain